MSHVVVLIIRTELGIIINIHMYRPQSGDSDHCSLLDWEHVAIRRGQQPRMWPTQRQVPSLLPMMILVLLSLAGRRPVVAKTLRPQVHLGIDFGSQLLRAAVEQTVSGALPRFHEESLRT